MAVDNKQIATDVLELVGGAENVTVATNCMTRLRLTLKDNSKADVEKIKKVAKTNSTVLIEGESGTGKELAARAVHMESLRSSAPFVVAYSAPDELLESNLFGHKKGSFTGATADKTRSERRSA